MELKRFTIYMEDAKTAIIHLKLLKFSVVEYRLSYMSYFYSIHGPTHIVGPASENFNHTSQES